MNSSRSVLRLLTHCRHHYVSEHSYSTDRQCRDSMWSGQCASPILQMCELVPWHSLPENIYENMVSVRAAAANPEPFLCIMSHSFSSYSQYIETATNSIIKACIKSSSINLKMSFSIIVLSVKIYESPSWRLWFFKFYLLTVLSPELTMLTYNLHFTHRNFTGS